MDYDGFDSVFDFLICFLMVLTCFFNMDYDGFDMVYDGFNIVLVWRMMVLICFFPAPID